MKRQHWKSKEKLEIVLEGLKDQCSVAERCARYGIRTSMVYKWRDQLLKNGDHGFESSVDQHTTQLEHQNKQLKALVGDGFMYMLSWIGPQKKSLAHPYLTHPKRMTG